MCQLQPYMLQFRMSGFAPFAADHPESSASLVDTKIAAL